MYHLSTYVVFRSKKNDMAVNEDELGQNVANCFHGVKNYVFLIIKTMLYVLIKCNALNA
jgi:hypothetical protein